MQAKTFSDLRRKVHAQCLINYGHRLKRRRLQPTMQEIVIGAFLEDLEMQVADAVLDMNQKGYCTWSSGFYGKRAEIQGIDGPFILDKTTTDKLTKMGIKVKTSKFHGRNYTDITFRPRFPNVRHIKQCWYKITSVIPPRKYAAILPENYGSWMFWENFAPSMRKIMILRLKRLILSKHNPRWIGQWQTQLRKLETVR